MCYSVYFIFIWIEITFNNLIHHERKEIIGEEIRLFYVALTRAKKGLYVHQDNFYNKNNNINKWADIMTWR